MLSESLKIVTASFGMKGQIKSKKMNVMLLEGQVVFTYHELKLIPS